MSGTRTFSVRRAFAHARRQINFLLRLRYFSVSTTCIAENARTVFRSNFAIIPPTLAFTPPARACLFVVVVSCLQQTWSMLSYPTTSHSPPPPTMLPQLVLTTKGFPSFFFIAISQFTSTCFVISVLRVTGHVKVRRLRPRQSA